MTWTPFDSGDHTDVNEVHTHDRNSKSKILFQENFFYIIGYHLKLWLIEKIK